MTVFTFNIASKTVDGRASLDRRGQLAYRSVIDESVDDELMSLPPAVVSSLRLLSSLERR